MRQNRTRKPEPAPLKRLLLVQIHGRPRHTGRKELLGHAAEAAQPADPGYAVTAKGDRIYPEGSPDIPEGGVVQRPDYVKVRAQDRHGEWFEVEGRGLTARAFCHEIDHLDGVLFIDKAIRMLSPEELEQQAKG